MLTHFTGYKMRTSIWKALKRRSNTICSAISRYNQLASQMNPPAPALDWKNVVNYAFVSEFDILRHAYSRVDITSCPWILPANREIASRHFKVLRAREELHRLNIEIRRLYTAISDEGYLLSKTVEGLLPVDPVLAAEVQDLSQNRARVNAVHLA